MGSKRPSYIRPNGLASKMTAYCLSPLETAIYERLQGSDTPIGPRTNEEQTLFHSLWCKSEGRVHREPARGYIGNFVYFYREGDEAHKGVFYRQMCQSEEES